MTSLINGIRNHIDCPCDSTPPRGLNVSGEFGDLTIPRVSAPTRIDPLVLKFGNVEPRSTIEFLNRSATPNASWAEHKQTLPRDDITAGLSSATLSVALTDAKAKELGIAPGDVLEFRQTDPSGNTSRTTLLKLDQRGGGDNTIDVIWDPRADRFESGGTGLRVDQSYSVLRHRDLRAPVVHPQLMAWSAGAGSADRGLSGSGAIEPSATVDLQNQRTLKHYSGVVDDSGQLALKFEAECGDPLQVIVRDRHGNATDLGVTDFGVGEHCSAGEGCDVARN
ncbi:MAG: hypothetical protein IPK13_09120 [Deltaproteobacteria bacterium]|nr:hypothetical protein [Deltaproteobacteria bacterium]